MKNTFLIDDPMSLRRIPVSRDKWRDFVMMKVPFPTAPRALSNMPDREVLKLYWRQHNYTMWFLRRDLIKSSLKRMPTLARRDREITLKYLLDSYSDTEEIAAAIRESEVALLCRVKGSLRRYHVGSDRDWEIIRPPKRPAPVLLCGAPGCNVVLQAVPDPDPRRRYLRVAPGYSQEHSCGL